MTDPYISSSFYMIEMLISYIFYLNTSEKGSVIKEYL